MAFSLVATVSGKSTNNGGFTTGAANTTGADLIVAHVAWYTGTTNPTLSDSYGNTWTGLTTQAGSDQQGSRLYYCYAPTVGSGHTFSLTGANTYPTVEALAFSGAAASPFDQESGATGGSGGTSLSPGSVTPSEASELLVTGHCFRTLGGTGQTPSVGGGFTRELLDTGVSGQCVGGAVGYLIQSAAAAANPAWTWATGDAAAATMAAFKAGALSPPPPPAEPMIFEF